MEEGRTSPQGNICPTFRHMGGTELFLCLLFLSCQLRLIHTPKWQILGWPDQFQQTEKITVEWEDRSMCFWTKTLGSLHLLSLATDYFSSSSSQDLFMFHFACYCWEIFLTNQSKLDSLSFIFIYSFFSNSRFYLCSRSHVRELPFDSKLLKQQMKYGPQFANEELESQTIKWHTKSQS